METHSKTGKGIGARLTRKEDDRYMRGRGEFVADIRLAGMKDVAFLRSPLAHARLHGINVPERLRDRVFTHDDMTGVRAIRAVTGLPGFKVSEQPPLATGKVRHVGELVAMCLGETRAEAEDVAAEIDVQFEELPVIVNMLQGQRSDSPLVHEDWGDNIYLESSFDGDLTEAKAAAAVTVTKEFRTNRQCMAPLEGKGAVAYWDSRLEQLVVYTATQMPHIVRTGLAECLGLDQAKVRVIAPDVGGGFGYKGILTPEEICLGWLAMHCGHPVRWIEDCREHLTANANCREHHYHVTAYADARGKILGLEAEASVDAGAYSAYPFSACLEGAQVVSILPGPYVIPAYHCKTYSVATNKAPILPYRGVARTGVCFVMELIIDAIARAVEREPYEVRLENLVPASAMPYTNITGKDFDSGDYPKSLRRAVEEIHLTDIRARQADGEPDGRLIGIGFATFCEQAAHGTSVYSGWGIPMVPGHEQAVARMTPGGSLELRIGAHSHGQSMETTLAQVAHEVLGIDPAKVKLVHGDTEYTPYSTGTWGSRCAVMSGGAVATACEKIAERAASIAAHLMQVSTEEVRFENGEIVGPTSSMSLEEVAQIWYLKPQLLPPDIDSGGLEVTVGYKPKTDSGTFSYASHAVVVAVDPELGDVEILDYVIIEDGGTLINPMVVEGQVYGGAGQGIGTALYEEMPFDAAGQPLASTLADYLLPGPTEMPHFRVFHMETPSPNTKFGIKGIGEGGAIAPPAAIGNAINDALASLGVELCESPMSPRRILAAIAEAPPREGA
ncbi:MAG TPA: xanthine dehydrogenase family protein molybdopterin-binding subunit [Rhodospirillales bacterium]|nr:xanthine dehydrogenase family protein molybdopterin-binding subunit [Rhodospirillales bacterium]